MHHDVAYQKNIIAPVEHFLMLHTFSSSLPAAKIGHFPTLGDRPQSAVCGGELSCCVFAKSAASFLPDM